MDERYTKPIRSNVHKYNTLQVEAITLVHKLAMLSQRAMPNITVADNYQRIRRLAVKRAYRRGVRFTS